MDGLDPGQIRFPGNGLPPFHPEIADDAFDSWRMSARSKSLGFG
jgi:hypothetical protein